ncbi:chaperone SurA [Luminiphilus syltensis NOR5-1B]|uniref:Chaperone SurA n=1 Tax=Luminiphilus syltensis NOR5-1B TaxID=565045 RepID=B8KVY5_9GAMM|nr:peptidylprolyl isomerase [Luminiphilus syltensis]EED35839.1 chaperone SurA [Luminiphilus syltensis NOR5-1B]
MTATNITFLSRALITTVLTSGMFLNAITAHAQAGDQVQILEQIVAIVDDDIILASELRERLDTLKVNIERQGAEMPAEDILVRETLDRLILESIQLQMGERYGIRIPDTQLDEALRRVASNNGLTLAQFRGALEAEGRSYAEMRESVRKEMTIQRVQQGNVSRNINISDAEIDNYLETEAGQELTEPQYRVFQALIPVNSTDSEAERASKEAFVDSALSAILDGQAFESAVSVTQPYAFQGGDLGWRKLSDIPSMFTAIVPTLDRGETGKVESGSGFHLVHVADVRGRERVIAQTKVRHILVKPSEVRTEAETEQLAADLRQRLLDGADFAELAKEYSEDIGSAQEGGDLGWTSAGQMVPEFEQAMAETEVDDIAPPVRSQFGWHVLEVTGRRDKDVSDEMRRNQVANYLHDAKYQEELDAWLRKIRTEAFVDIK